MANVVYNQINIHASKNAIDWLEEQFNLIDTLEYNEKPVKIIELFGTKGDDIYDKIGAKWLTLDNDCKYRESEDCYYFQYETGNHPPEEMIKNLFNILSEKSDEDFWCYIDGRYWDEGFDPVGIFECNVDGYFSAEDSIEVDYDDVDYWENQVQPIFDELEI